MTHADLDPFPYPRTETSSAEGGEGGGHHPFVWGFFVTLGVGVAGLLMVIPPFFGLFILGVAVGGK